MYKDKKVAVIIAAAGLGKRMRSDMPKQYMKIEGKPMVAKTAEVFAASDFIDVICIVTAKDYVEKCRSMFADCEKVKAVVMGGKERQDSVACGLRALKNGGADTEFDYVMIHDAARPYVTDGLIGDSLEKAAAIGACTAAVPVKDTIRYKNMTLERNELYAVQTPQTFEKTIITEAYERAYSDGFYGTDDAGLVERIGKAVAIVPGDYGNIKITTPEDLPKSRGGAENGRLGEQAAMCEMKVGTGFDVHAFAEDRRLILGGVEIPYHKGLAGHSDADVLIHAVMDAILGAAAMGDIGRHFPDTDDKYKGISSLCLLDEAKKIIEKAGFALGNIDVTLIAQKPKIAPYIDDMREKIAGTLNIEENRINIKGTTTEKLGFTGRGEGIACEAVCLLYGREAEKK